MGILTEKFTCTKENDYIMGMVELLDMLFPLAVLYFLIQYEVRIRKIKRMYEDTCIELRALCKKMET